MAELNQRSKHFAYTDIVDELVNGGWGARFNDKKAAQLEMLESLNLTGACLLAILKRVDRFTDLLAKDSVAKERYCLSEDAEKAVGEFIEEREKKHGLCPDIVQSAIWKEIYRNIGRQVIRQIHVTYIPYVEPPEKGTEARKQYDKWMRHKKPKETQHA